MPDEPLAAAAGARIAVLAACFNRRELTLRGLASLRAAATAVDYHVYLVDDGSTDGTAAAVRAGHPEVTVIEGDGSLYWNGGMRRAWQAAIPSAPDYYLWWNDDLELLPRSVDDLLAFQRELEARHGPRVITIGKVTDPADGAVTYGGYVRRPGLSRLSFARAPDHLSECATMNGNCVLIPTRAVDEVGIHSEHYTHSSGDVDYGLRAGKAGYRLFQSPHVVGHTAYNVAFAAGHKRLNLSNWRFIFTHPKGLPLKEWMHFCRAHGGAIWPVNFAARYLKILGR